MNIVNMFLSKKGKVLLNKIIAERNDLTPSERYFSVTKFGRCGKEKFEYVDLCKLYKIIVKNGKCGSRSKSKHGFNTLHTTMTNAIIVHNLDMIDKIQTDPYNNVSVKLRKPVAVLFDCSVPSGVAHVITLDEPKIKKTFFGTILDFKNSMTVEKINIYDDTDEVRASQQRPPILAADPLPRYERDRVAQESATKHLENPMARGRAIERNSRKTLAEEWCYIDECNMYFLKGARGENVSFEDFIKEFKVNYDLKVAPLLREDDKISGAFEYFEYFRGGTIYPATKTIKKCSVQDFEKNLLDIISEMDDIKSFKLEYKIVPLT